MDDRKNLADLCEREDASQRRFLLTEAYALLRPGAYMKGRSGWASDWPEFELMLDAQAFESAAMKLVPAGWSVGIGHLPGVDWQVRAHLRDHRPDSLSAEGHSVIWVEGHHMDFALSLCAAALRAHAKMEA